MSEILKLFGELELYSLVNMKYLTNDEMLVIYGHCNCEAILLSKDFFGEEFSDVLWYLTNRE